jgi:hypothetical protein
MESKETAVDTVKPIEPVNNMFCPFCASLLYYNEEFQEHICTNGFCGGFEKTSKELKEMSGGA